MSPTGTLFALLRSERFFADHAFSAVPGSVVGAGRGSLRFPVKAVWLRWAGWPSGAKNSPTGNRTPVFRLRT